MVDFCLIRSALFLSLSLLLFISPSFISADHSKIQNYSSGTTPKSLQELGEKEDPQPITIKIKKSTKNNNQTKPTTKPTSNPSSKPIKSGPLTKTQIRKPKHTPKNSAPPKKKPNKAPQLPDQIDADDADGDLVSGFRDLPSKFQQSIVPDLTKISETSKIYLTRYNREFTRGVKPYVGGKYAAAFASYLLFGFIIIPLIVVSLVFNKIQTHFSIRRILIFAEVYLAIYFSILGLSCFVTGLEPLGFFYSASRSRYVCVQVVQSLGYALYLLLLLMYLVLVFSTETGLPAKALGLGQTAVGFSVGLHYYMTVFHRALLLQQPKSSWRAQGLYAMCFVVICLLGRAERRKKAYLEEGGEEGKMS